MKVDAKGRIVLPKEFRDRFDLEAGDEVVVSETDGRLVVEPEDDPAAIVDDIEALVEAGAASADPDPPSKLDPVARDHVDAIRRQAGADSGDR